MTNEELLIKTQELITIESTALNPVGLHEAYDFMVKFLQTSGKNITVERFESNGKPSLLAYKSTTRPEKFHVIFNGHLDVVPGKPLQYGPYIKNGKLYGRGAHDMKAACTVMADVFCEFVDKLPFALGLQLVSDEENSGKDGTLYQIQQGVRGDFVICGECGRAPETYEIANCAKGTGIVEVSFSGLSAHAAYPWKGDNAAVKAAHFVHELHQRYPKPENPISGSTVTVTAISSNSDAHTKIPDGAIVKLNARFTPGDPMLSDITKFTAFIKSIDPTAEVVSVHDFSSPLYADPNNAQLQRLKAAAEKIENHSFSFVQRHGTSDGRFYTDVGNEACEFGIAGEHQHGDDEYVTIEAFNNYRETLYTFLASYE